MTCASDASEEDAATGHLDCQENYCAQYVFDFGVVAHATDGCVDFNVSGDENYTQFRLNTHSDPECHIHCDVGFEEQRGVISCAINATEGQDVTGQITCVENLCAPFEFAFGEMAGDDNGCADGKELQTRTDNTCGVKCKKGFVDQTSTMICDEHASAGDEATGHMYCQENFCAPFIFGQGVVAAADSEDPCYYGIKLTTQSDQSCQIMCDTDYYEAGYETILCAIDADEADQAASSLVCVPLEQEEWFNTGSSAQPFMSAVIALALFVMQW